MVEGPWSRGRRLASAATLGIPVGLTILVFLVTWLNATTSGAGMSEGNRPIMVFMLAAFGAFGWFIATSALYAVHRRADGLPRTARVYALQLVWGPSSNRDGTLPARTTATVRQLVGLAAVLLPVLMFTPPMLLGWLTQRGVWRLEEAAAVGVMGVVVVAWSLFLVMRARGSQ